MVPSKVIEKETISNNYGVRGYSPYRSYKNIFLSEDEYAENVKYHIEKEHQELVARNRGICFEEKEMAMWTFQNAGRENHAIKIAEDYVSNWEEMKRKHMEYLMGGTDRNREKLFGRMDC